MKKSIDWSALTVPLDVGAIGAPPDFVRRWMAYTRTETGLVFHWQTAGGETVDFRVDVYSADVLRFRLNPAGLRSSPSDMLADTVWPPLSFDVDAQTGCVALTTERERLEWQRFPWQMRAYALEAGGRPAAAPFFSERIDDRAYGPGYEVAPLGFEPLPGRGLGAA